MSHVLGHLRSLWGPWWWAPGGLYSAYAATMIAIGDVRFEHILVTVLVMVFAYSGPRSKQFFVDIFPFIVTGTGYDAVRYARAAVLTADRVWSCGLREVDLALFPAGGGISIQEWLVAHPTKFFDLLAAAPYGVFFMIAFVYATYLYFVDRPRMRRYLWAFAVANYTSFCLWLIIPAAPPWYVHQFGCTIDLAAEPSAAGLLRADEHLGISFYREFYTRAASVYGAMPSMHNAYPMLGLLTAWSSITWKTKPIHILYVVWMFWASLYTDHHWIIDAIAGWFIAWFGVRVARRIAARLEPAGDAAAEPLAEPA